MRRIEAQTTRIWQMEKEMKKQMAGGTSEGQPKQPRKSPPAAPQHSRSSAAV
jgi:hypothetical protein